MRRFFFSFGYPAYCGGDLLGMGGKYIKYIWDGVLNISVWSWLCAEEWKPGWFLKFWKLYDWAVDRGSPTRVLRIGLLQGGFDGLFLSEWVGDYYFLSASGQLLQFRLLRLSRWFWNPRLLALWAVYLCDESAMVVCSLLCKMQNFNVFLTNLVQHFSTLFSSRVCRIPSSSSSIYT